MRIVSLDIQNFRCIKQAHIAFKSQTVLVGDNNCGKSTVLEAIDLVLGPDRMSRHPVVDEYDFFTGKYLNNDEPISLTDIARRFEPENPSYLIQSWLRSRNTIEFLGEWERNNNKQFNEEAFQKLLKDVRSPSYTLTPKRWIETVNAIGLESKRGKNGGTMAHPFIACDFEMWNDMQFRYEVLKYFMSSRIETDNEE